MRAHREGEVVQERSGVYYGGKFHEAGGETFRSVNPATGEVLGVVRGANRQDHDAVVAAATEDFHRWKQVPGPVRGQLAHKIGDALRKNKERLGRLVSQENGKIYQEGLGEIQEAIDIADYAVGLSRQLYGVTTHSERPQHRMYEQWHPIGVNAYVTAFNFPVAVWAWNAMIGAVCGNSSIWKPSPKTSLVSVATQEIIDPILREAGFPSLMALVIGGADVGQWIAEDRRITLVSFTGSTQVGRKVSHTVAARLGRTILELGGNNAMIVSDKADLKLALPALVFGAVGTAGQRCTTTRRLIVHESIKDSFVEKLVKAYKQVRIGDPLEQETLMGPLIDPAAVDGMQKALARAREEGGKVLTGGDVLRGDKYKQGNFVTPAVVEARPDMSGVKEETFAPILYVMSYRTIQEAVEINNGVDQGLSSSIFTLDLREAEYFLSHVGSDCGIANVNTGTSGAEIGLAFGGEKDTGGGRESGSDSWKAYMRRQTNTTNWSAELPLAQGIRFDF